ncbi:tRNA pseudouridine(55) synthase TruB [Aestuariivivens sediminis]|uniref:tRNA pseudouridine(55) synthase TruB n=1 Tax=Aestuariivivens sediminis TaxID=2913557 RepID=UPI001F569158|nr:tRNA pseudouridine(55) synthase TruB [Aestuariivivens sediminis]
MLTKDDYLSGQLVLIDKPLNWTSFQVVNKLRWEIKHAFNLKKLKVGHAGTLDPLATGLLLICTGKMTKQIYVFQSQVKEYTGTFTIGSTTPSFDLETGINKNFPTSHITEELIHKTAEQFVGDIEQLPPVYSAVKKDGKRLYEFARANEAVEINPRIVNISAFDILNIDRHTGLNTAALNVDFRVVCSKGTYIRSLANDFGKALESGAHLSALRRTKIGDFKVEEAAPINVFIDTLKG